MLASPSRHMCHLSHVYASQCSWIETSGGPQTGTSPWHGSLPHCNPFLTFWNSWMPVSYAISIASHMGVIALSLAPKDFGFAARDYRTYSTCFPIRNTHLNIVATSHAIVCLFHQWPRRFPNFCIILVISLLNGYISYFFYIAYLNISLYLDIFCFSFCLCFCWSLLVTVQVRTPLAYRFLSSMELFAQDKILEMVLQIQSAWTFHDS